MGVAVQWGRSRSAAPLPLVLAAVCCAVLTTLSAGPVRGQVTPTILAGVRPPLVFRLAAFVQVNSTEQVLPDGFISTDPANAVQNYFVQVKRAPRGFACDPYAGALVVRTHR